MNEIETCKGITDSALKISKEYHISFQHAVCYECVHPNARICEKINNGSCCKDIETCRAVKRNEMIKFLQDGEKKLGIPYSKTYGDFSKVSDEEIEKAADELGWIWK